MKNSQHIQHYIHKLELNMNTSNKIINAYVVRMCNVRAQISLRIASCSAVNRSKPRGYIFWNDLPLAALTERKGHLHHSRSLHTSQKTLNEVMLSSGTHEITPESLPACDKGLIIVSSLFDEFLVKTVLSFLHIRSVKWLFA